MTGRPGPNGAFPVLVLGVGTIGSGWGAWFSHRGLPVCLVDPGWKPAAMQDAVAPSWDNCGKVIFPARRWPEM